MKPIMTAICPTLSPTLSAPLFNGLIFSSSWSPSFSDKSLTYFIFKLYGYLVIIIIDYGVIYQIIDYDVIYQIIWTVHSNRVINTY